MAGWQPPTLWKYTLREMQRRPGRTILTLLGIILGVAAAVAIRVTTTTTHRAFCEMFEAVAGRASLEVVAEGFGGFRPDVAAQLQSVAGVQAAVPIIQTQTVVLGASGSTGALVLGMDPSSEEAARHYVLQQGQPLGVDDGVLLDAGFARAQGCELGKKVQLLTPTMTDTGPRIAELPILGLLQAKGAARFNGGAVVVMPVATAQRLFALQGRVNCIQIVLAEGANVLQVEAALRQRLPDGLTVQAPATRGELAQDSLMSTELGLGSLSVVSLIAGGIVIVNSFLMNLGERRRHLAILRALGATRAQVARLLLREAALYGIAGTVLGIPVGLALSVSLQQLMERLLGVTLPNSHWPLSLFVFAVILGPAMTLVAICVPARRAARRAPLEDLLQKAETLVERSWRWPRYLGLLFVAAMLILTVGILCEWFPPEAAPSLLVPAISLFLIGSVLAIPLVLRPLLIFSALFLKPFLGVEGRLAFRQLERRPTRTALTVGVLLIGIVVGISSGQSLLNNVRDIYTWYERNLYWDFVVRGVVPDTTLVTTVVPLPEALAEQLAAVDGVEHVAKVSFVIARVPGRQIVAMPCTIDPKRRLPFVLTTGDPSRAAEKLLQGEVVLGTPLAQRLGLKAGDELTIQTRHGPRPLRIAGTTSEYTVGGMALYMEWNKGKELFDIPGVHVFPVTAKPGAAAAVATGLRQFCQDHGLRLQSNAEFRESIEQAVAGVVGFYWMLLALVSVVAALGIVNTLTMNVLEQTRELGILRAVAFTRGQVRKMILAQALALGITSLVPGTGLGIGLAYLMNLATHPVLGQRVAFRFDGWYVGLCLMVTLVFALLAAFFPARRAARLRIIQALQYE
ncbi:MAG TPA: FtsX-like permease family protein [Gemmataceae bacterium]|nr:FtsX-like permease family protein [Gemmataceae bacterium]